MAVYFVYRSHYHNPGCFYRKRFEADSVLGWFQSIWQPKGEVNAGEHADRLLGANIYSFGSLFEKIDEEEWAAPKTMKALTEYLEEALYVNEMKYGGHHVQIHTDDDELEMAVYVFDDHYVEKHPDRTAFLMREDWRLPDGMAAGHFKLPSGVPRAFPKAVSGEGRTYFAHFAAYDSGGLTDLEPGMMTGVIDGVRVPDLPRFLLAVQGESEERDDKEMHSSIGEVLTGLAPATRTAKGGELALLKAVRANPNDTACWAAYSDWLLENDRPTLLERILAKCDAPSGAMNESRNPKRDSVLVQSHVAQACKHVACFDRIDLFHHFIFFDDLWANAHPLLAGSILRTANRWDPL